MDVRFFAGAAEAAGVEALTVDAAGMSGRDLVAHLADGNDRLALAFSRQGKLTPEF